MAECKRRALITGITGQSGSYLAEFLLGKGYEVHGLIRRSSLPVEAARARLEKVRGQIHFHYGDMTDPFSLLWILKKVEPDEIYNLAAQSHVQVSWETPWYTAQATGVGLLNLLESVRLLGLNPRIYQASTSELYSGKEKEPQTETTRFDPASPYGTAKLYAFQIAKNYREAFGMFISNGILFNHESPRRGDSFVTKKIVNAAKSGEPVELGNMDAKRDWGAADEYMQAAWTILQQGHPDDFVISTGESHSVSEFVAEASRVVGKEIKVILNKDFLRPSDVQNLHGDSTKARQVFGWYPKKKFKEVVRWMIEGDDD